MKRWKRREAEFASIFGVRRRPLSGGSGIPGKGRDDFDGHPTLFGECKDYARQAVRTLWRETNAKAVKEIKVPVLGLYERGRHGALIVVHEDDMINVVAAWLAAQDQATVETVEYIVVRLREQLAEMKPIEEESPIQ